MNWRQLPNSLSHATGRSVQKLQDIVDQAVLLMRSPEFRDHFPGESVTRWSRRYRAMLTGLPVN